MTIPTVVVVDYGIGNLFSVRRAFESVGAEVRFASSALDIEEAGRLVLPGVGAFSDGMTGLESRGMVEALRKHARSGKPLLGICLGMQMFASGSQEFGEHEGLGIIPGTVVPVASRAVNGGGLKIPHIGWTPLREARPSAWKASALESTAHGACVYLVHSFHFVPTDRKFVLATCDYGGNEVIAAVGDGRIIGCQFHPEKSGPVGLEVLRRFLEV